MQAEINIQADAQSNDLARSYRSLKGAIVRDLQARGADLAVSETFTLTEPMPSLALAQRLYRDPTRSDELVLEVNPIHSLFMPTKFKALSA